MEENNYFYRWFVIYQSLLSNKLELVMKYQGSKLGKPHSLIFKANTEIET